MYMQVASTPSPSYVQMPMQQQPQGMLVPHSGEREGKDKDTRGARLALIVMSLFCMTAGIILLAVGMFTVHWLQLDYLGGSRDAGIFGICGRDCEMYEDDQDVYEVKDDLRAVQALTAAGLSFYCIGFVVVLVYTFLRRFRWIGYVCFGICIFAALLAMGGAAHFVRSIESGGHLLSIFQFVPDATTVVAERKLPSDDIDHSYGYSMYLVWLSALPVIGAAVMCIVAACLREDKKTTKTKSVSVRHDGMMKAGPVQPVWVTPQAAETAASAYQTFPSYQPAPMYYMQQPMGSTQMMYPQY